MKWQYPKVLFLFTIFLASAFLVNAVSTVPGEISFGFQLFNTSTGGGLNDTHDTVFTLYKDVSGGPTFLNESQRISYTNGIGHVTLRNTSGIQDWSIQYRITIKVADGSETTPRINITPVPQALYAQNATYAVNASNSSFAGTASALAGSITESQISDFRLYPPNFSDAIFGRLNASNWSNVTITQSQILDHTIIQSIGAQDGANITAGQGTAINITGDSSSVLTSISGTILTIRAAITNSITTLFTQFVHFTGGASFTEINSTNATIYQNLSLGSPPAECPTGTYMTQFNGTVSLCVAAASRSGDNFSGIYNFSGNYTFVLNTVDMVDIDASTTPSAATSGVFRIDHRAGADGVDVMKINSDINGFAGGRIMSLIYTLTGLGVEQSEVVVGISVDRAAASNGTVHALSVDAFGFDTSTHVEALHIGPTVEVLTQEAGVFQTADNAFTFSGGFIDVSANFSDITSENATMFINDNDIVYIGHSETFGNVEVILQTFASGAGIRPDFAHSADDGGSAVFDDFEPIDGTNGFRQNGVIDIDQESIPNWNQTSINGVSKFWLRVTRTQNGLGTEPVEGRIHIAIPTEYGWDVGGNVTINNLIVEGDQFNAVNISSGNLTMSNESGTAYTCGVVGLGTFTCSIP